MMSKSTRRNFTAEEEAIFRQAAAEDDAEMDVLSAEAREDFARLEHLADAVRALRAEREAQGISLADMEARCGITRATLSRLENASHPNPTISTLMRIAAALNIELTIALSKPKEAA